MYPDNFMNYMLFFYRRVYLGMNRIREIHEDAFKERKPIYKFVFKKCLWYFEQIFDNSSLLGKVCPCCRIIEDCLIRRNSCQIMIKCIVLKLYYLFMNSKTNSAFSIRMTFRLNPIWNPISLSHICGIVFTLYILAFSTFWFIKLLDT